MCGCWRISHIVMLLLSAVMLVYSHTASEAHDSWLKLRVVKGGFIVGAEVGKGTLYRHRRAYPISAFGIGAGAIIGGSVARLKGRVYNLRRVGDIAGKYFAVGAGGAIIKGASVVKLRNSKGVVLKLSGSQLGLEFSLNLSGMVLALD